MELSFEQLPQAVSKVYEKLEAIEELLKKGSNVENSKQDELLTVQDAAKFLTLSVPTIYGLISKGELPVMKRSKRCYFSKIELIGYLKLGRKKTLAESSEAANQYLNRKAR